MTVTGDGGIALFGILVAVVAVVIAWLKPDKIRAQYEAKLARLEHEIDELRLEYRRMATEYLRIVGENHWLRIQLRAHGIDIPPLPDDLKPKTDAHGNISILVSPAGGVQVLGGQVDAKHDIVGGDTSVGRDSIAQPRDPK